VANSVTNSNLECDFLIIGSGLAGLAFALKISEEDDHFQREKPKIIIVTKEKTI
jgi:succinate dehydrogenase/fumarate reductase flavoprotein subunit